MNFFNDQPDNRFTDPSFTSAFIQTNYYQVALPNQYGDVILILNEQGNAIHSAVHLANDIVFTKNGGHYGQPWMLMHLKDLLDQYTTDAAPKIMVYRSRNS